MNQTVTEFTYGRLGNKDEAFRVSLLLLINDPCYQLLPLRQVMTFYRCVCSDNYLFVFRNKRAIAVIMWMEVSAEVSNDCLINDRSPFVSELTGKSDAIYCLAFVSLEPKALLQLWRKFAMNYTERDILIKRHFKGGKSMVKPIVLIRNLKKEKFETG